MCGIAGFFHGQSAELPNPIITQMCDRIIAAISASLANFRVLNWKKWLEICPSLTGHYSI